MQFATFEFLWFFLGVLTCAWLLRPYVTGRKVFLLVASYAFYAGWDHRLAILLGLKTLADWWLGDRIVESPTVETKRRWLWLSLAINLAVLGWYKYYNFFRDNIEAFAQLLGTTSGLPVLEVLLPVGISYVTFQGMAYTVDLYRGHGVRAKSLLDFSLFMAFFPQVLIGPICRSRDLLPQLEAPAPRGVPNLSEAVGRISSGLFKKVVLATWLNTHLTEEAFNAPEGFSSLELLLAAYAYTIEIYCDFSGYTDLAIGIALLLGIRLPDNFNQPYRATSIAEFWRRWHMTFSNWLRDYVFLPLGGSRVGTLGTWRNLMIVMLVTGIWHGAAWKFVVWGAIHGFALIAYKIVQDRRRERGVNPKTLTFPWWYHAMAWAYTFHLVVLARIFFRSTDLEVGLAYWRGLLQGTTTGQGVEWILLPIMALGLSLHFIGGPIRRGFEHLHEQAAPVLRPAIWLTVAYAILTLQPADVAPYIYFAF